MPVRRHIPEPETPRRQITIRVELQEIPRKYASAETIAEFEVTVDEAFYTDDRAATIVGDAVARMTGQSLDRRTTFEQGRIDATIAKVDEARILDLTGEGARQVLDAIRRTLVNQPDPEPEPELVLADALDVAADPIPS